MLESLPSRIREKIKVNPSTECWEWTAGDNGSGYGLVQWNGKQNLAHRVVYALINGEIPYGKTLDHLCRNRSCANPEHLEPVSHKENLRRGETGKKTGRKQKEKTHCPQGHPYDKHNTHYRSSGERVCMSCNRDRQRRRRAKIRSTQQADAKL